MKPEKDTIDRFKLKAGDIFIEYDNSGHKAIRYAQRLTGNIKYSNFVHGGIVDPSNVNIIHATGADKLTRRAINSLLDHKEYRIYRVNDIILANKVAEVAELLYKNSRIPYDYKIRDLFKIGVRPSTPSKRANEHERSLHALKSKQALESKMKQYLEQKNNLESFSQDATSYCTELITFVYQYSAMQLEMDYLRILNINNNKAIPARLVEILKKSAFFKEYKSIERNKKGNSGLSFIRGTF